MKREPNPTACPYPTNTSVKVPVGVREDFNAVR